MEIWQSDNNIGQSKSYLIYGKHIGKDYKSMYCTDVVYNKFTKSNRLLKCGEIVLQPQKLVKRLINDRIEKVYEYLNKISSEVKDI